MNESTQGNNFQIVLNSKPDQAVKVYFEGVNLRFMDASITFTTENWMTPRRIKVRYSPMWCAASNQETTLTMRVFTRRDKYVDQNYKIYRVVVPGQKCTSSGDPHIIMFDGLNAKEYHAPMTQTLFSNQDIDVQQIQRNCSKATTANCGVAVAIRYGSSVYIVDTRGGDIAAKSATKNIDGVDYSTIKAVDNKGKLQSLMHLVKLPEGSNIEVTVFPYQTTGYYLNVGIFIAPSHFIKTTHCNSIAYTNGGVCGSLESIAGKVRCRGSLGWVANTIENNIQYHTSWKVPDSESFFLNHTWFSTVPLWRSMFSSPLPMTTVFDTLQARKLDASLEVYQRDLLAERDLPPGNPDPVNVISSVEASLYCTRQITGGPCTSVVNPAPFIDSCVTDAITLGSFVMATSHQSSFMEECLAITNLLIRSEIPTQVSNGQDIQRIHGMNDNACPSTCVGHTCYRLGCVCSGNSYGMFCNFIA
jgi:hypothetical protein